MKKKIILIAVIVILLILFFPIPMRLNDGGTIEYTALTYRISKIHRLNHDLVNGYEDGWKIEILGMKVYNRINFSEKKVAQIDTDNITNYEENIQKYFKVVDDVKIELDIPNDWKYEEMYSSKEDDFFKYGLKLYKTNEERYTVLYVYKNQFGVCGTERTERKLSLNNGKEATVGYYSGNESWSDISFWNINKDVAIMNYTLSNDEEKEVLNFIKTINISENQYTQ